MAMDKSSWSMPTWDTLFAGRKATVAQADKDQSNDYGNREAITGLTSGEEVSVIAKQGQGKLEEELQGAFSEQLPGSLSAPSQAHLVSSLSSQELFSSPSSSSFPEVIRKSHDGVGKSHASLSSTQAEASWHPTLAAGSVSEEREKESDALAKPQETWHPKASESVVQHIIKPVHEVQRAGKQSESQSAIAINNEAGSARPSLDTMRKYTDTPSGQWAEGAAPVASTDADIQGDLWNTMTSLFGIGDSATTVGKGDGSDGFYGAVSHLQGILGESKSEEAKWKENQKGEIDRAIQQSSLTEEDGNSSSAEGQGYEAKSGVRHQPTYLSPRLPIVFAHGLFGFDEFHLTPAALREALPLTVTYWRGIVDILKRRGVEVLVAKVPMSASIEERAQSLCDMIEKEFPHREINLIAHSMGGLDGRFACSQLDTTFTIRSLTTIASPHRGSTFADFMLDKVIGQERLPKLLSWMEKAGLPGGGRAFACLTTHAMKEFNERVHDSPNTVYMSWGAAHQPGFFHEFRIPYGIVAEKEGPNDGLVSVESSKWGTYRGTLRASHLDLIGWKNQVASFAAKFGPKEEPFDPLALYLTICEDLANLGL